MGQHFGTRIFLCHSQANDGKMIKQYLEHHFEPKLTITLKWPVWWQTFCPPFTTSKIWTHQCGGRKALPPYLIQATADEHSSRASARDCSIQVNCTPDSGLKIGLAQSPPPVPGLIAVAARLRCTPYCRCIRCRNLGKPGNRASHG